jgi:cytochrome oxidase Cu insertion factor (SCO1/SenC/PrrC family)
VIVRLRTSRFAVAGAMLSATVVLAGCVLSGNGGPASPSPTYFDPISAMAEPTVPAWLKVQLTNVNTGKQFTIGDFSGRVVLLNTMATWCPTCQGEMGEMQQLPGMLGAKSGNLVIVSLDVDPNEDATILAKYAAANDFDWYVAIAPTEVGQFLATNYDIDYLNPPLQPMLFIDKTGGVYGLPTGVKPAESLRNTIDPYLTR